MYCENPYRLNFEPGNSSGFRENWGNVSKSVKPSLVLDGEKGELVKASKRVGKDIIGVSETKTKAALKSHSDAERRRRDRINAHLATLRGLVPNCEKMDKATLLAEVVNQVKQLKATATQANKGLHIPMDNDEVQVEKLEKNVGHGLFLLRASICCEYRPDLLSDLRQAINDLNVRVLKCEISTLEGRVKSVFFISGSAVAEEFIVNSIRSALSDILEKVLASAEYAQELYFPQKRRRVSYNDSSCLESGEFS